MSFVVTAFTGGVGEEKKMKISSRVSHVNSKKSHPRLVLRSGVTGMEKQKPKAW